jgi:hypothetical protein
MYCGFELSLLLLLVNIGEEETGGGGDLASLGRFLLMERYKKINWCKHVMKGREGGSVNGRTIQCKVRRSLG